MQTPFITDLRAVTVPLDGPKGPAAAISLRYFDETGRHIGNSVMSAAELAEQARALLAMAEAAMLHAVGADGAVKPPHHHFPIMRDVRVTEAA